MKAHSDRRRGQVLLMATLCSIPMFGILGMVTDLGYMHYVKMTAQSAAEAAAKSAMIDFHATTGGATYTCGGNVVCASTETSCTPNITAPANSIEHGCMYGQAHGFNSTGSLTYESGTASTPPPTAPNIGSAQYWVTFRAYQTVPQLFSAVLGNLSGQVVGRSTAAVVGLTDCIYTLKPSNTGISVGGTANLTSACGVLSDSSDPCAISTNGGAVLSAPEYDVVGGTCTHAALTPAPNTGISPASDPLASLPAPATAPYTCDYVNYSAPNWSNPTLSPGVYCGGIQIRNNNYTLSAGKYILVGGGLYTQNANANVSGTNVTIYNTYDATYPYTPINIAATSSVNLQAPNTGTYAGILFFEDRSAPEASDSYGGGSTAVYQGTIYAPHADITLYGNSSTTAYTIVVANTISLVGTSQFNNNYSGLPGGASPLQQVMVVE